MHEKGDKKTDSFATPFNLRKKRAGCQAILKSWSNPSSKIEKY